MTAEEYAALHGLELDTSLKFHDLGISAFRGKNTEEGGRLAEFLMAVHTGLVPEGSYLLVESLDRLSRQQPRKSINVLGSIVDAGVTVVTLTDGRKYDQKTLDEDPLALMVALLTFIRAREESETKALRIRAAWKGKREKAKEAPVTATAPSWLSLDKATGTWSVDEAKAEVIRRIFDLAIKGYGTNAIAVMLNEEGVPVFGRGKRWFRGTIGHILGHPATIGTFVPHTQEYVDGSRKRRPVAGAEVLNYYPAVIDEATFRKVEAIMAKSAAHYHAKNPARGRNANARVTNLFGGLLRCAHCGETVSVINSNNKKKGKALEAAIASGEDLMHRTKRLACNSAKYGKGCPWVTAHYSNFETTFLDQCEALIATAPSGTETVDAELHQVEAAIEALEEYRAEVKNRLVGAPASARGGLIDSLVTTEGELSDLRKQHSEILARASAVSGPLVAGRLADLKAALFELKQAIAEDAQGGRGVDRKSANAAMRTVFQHVEIDLKGKSARLYWRHAMPTNAAPGDAKGSEGSTTDFLWGFA